jgi:hypothetical protein
MTDIAIRVDHLSKLYHIGRARQRHDTPSAELRTGLRDVLSSVFSRQSSVFSRQSRSSTENCELTTRNSQLATDPASPSRRAPAAWLLLPNRRLVRYNHPSNNLA